MKLTRGFDGQLVRRGRVEQRSTWTAAFAASALPSWMTVNLGGTPTFTQLSGATGPSKVTVPSASNNIRLVGPQIIPQQYLEIEFSLSGLSFSADNGWNALFGIGDTGNDRGVMLIHNNSTVDSTAFLRGYQSSSAFDDHGTHYQMQKLNGGSRRPRNMSMLWRPAEGVVGILEGDQVVTQCVVSGLNLTLPVRPVFGVFATDAAAKSVSFARTDLVIRHS